MINDGSNHQYIQLISITGIFTKGNQQFCECLMPYLKYIITYKSHLTCSFKWKVNTKKALKLCSNHICLYPFLSRIYSTGEWQFISMNGSCTISRRNCFAICQKFNVFLRKWFYDFTNVWEIIMTPSFHIYMCYLFKEFACYIHEISIIVQQLAHFY